MSRTIDASKRRWYYHQWFKTLDAFTDSAMRDLNRSEIAVYFILLRDTRPDGTARAGLSDLARRGGMSRSSATRAIRSLIGRKLLTVLKPGVPGKVSLYSVLPLDVLAKLNPTAAKWAEGSHS